MNKNYSVGELAQRSGLTVRALHHYEKLGLLLPSARSEAGYRLYSEADVLRLHRLLAWRQTGMALKDIGPLLDSENPALREVLARQVAALQAQMLQQQQLLDALQHVARQAEGLGAGAGAGADDEPSLIEHLLFAMSMMRVQDKYFNAEDRLVLAQQKAANGARARARGRGRVAGPDSKRAAGNGARYTLWQSACAHPGAALDGPDPAVRG